MDQNSGRGCGGGWTSRAKYIQIVFMENDTSQKLVVLKGLEHNEAISLGGLQEFLLPHVFLISAVWWSIWVALFIRFVCKYILPSIFSHRENDP